VLIKALYDFCHPLISTHARNHKTCYFFAKDATCQFRFGPRRELILLQADGLPLCYGGETPKHRVKIHSSVSALMTCLN